MFGSLPRQTRSAQDFGRGDVIEAHALFKLQPGVFGGKAKRIVVYVEDTVST